MEAILQLISLDFHKVSHGKKWGDCWDYRNLKRASDKRSAQNLIRPWFTSLENTLVLGKVEVRRRRRQQRLRGLAGIIDSMDVSLRRLRDCEGQGSLGRCSPWRCKESNMTEPLNNNTNPSCKRHFRGEFPGSPTVRTQCFCFGGLGSILGQGTDIPKPRKREIFWEKLEEIWMSTGY